MISASVPEGASAGDLGPQDGLHTARSASPDSAPGAVCEGQLTFGPQQGVLDEAVREPQQLVLLPDPPPWEIDPGPPPYRAKVLSIARDPGQNDRAAGAGRQTALF